MAGQTFTLESLHGEGIVAKPRFSFHATADHVIPPTTLNLYRRLQGFDGLRFQPHYHPYASDLVQWLVKPPYPEVAGLGTLQSIDTRYKTDEAGNWIPMLKTTVAELAEYTDGTLDSVAEATLGDESPITLMPGTSVTLGDRYGIVVPDGAQLQSGGGTIVSVPAVIKPSSRATLGDDGTIVPYASDVTLQGNTVVDLTAGALLTLSDDSVVRLSATAQVRFNAGTSMKLFGAKPLPEFFEGPLFKNEVPTYIPGALVLKPYPANELDFSTSGAYSVYNWETFYHSVLMVAMHLSKNQRFADAQRWFHYIFDPTDGSNGPTPERFWKVLPFKVKEVAKIEEILVNLATGADTALREQTIQCIQDWRDRPFRPHLVARYRPTAYMIKTVMAYLDNLIAWGDSLFRQDTRESINEATQIYILAMNLLGAWPQEVPRKGTLGPKTYASLKEANLDEFGNALVGLETDVGFDSLGALGAGAAAASAALTSGTGTTSLYFCVPRNDKLVGIWTTVTDRLFKIHNSLNLQGTFRQLALFAPPIDPALLAKGAAAGLDVGAILSGGSQPLPSVRFQLLVQKATEICQEVKSLGGGLLAAMEKGDNEALAILRAKHERVMAEMVEQVRYSQLQDAIKAKEGLLHSLALAIQRYTYYERQLGKKIEEIQSSIPQREELDKDGLIQMAFAMTEPELGLRNIDVDIAEGALAQAAQKLDGGKLVSSHEVEESLLLESAQLASDIGNVLNMLSSIAHLIPEAHVNISPIGVGAEVEFGGQEIGTAAGAAAMGARALADRMNFEARRASRIDSFARREREWAFQSNLAGGEISQIYKQIRAAEIREAIAEFELKNHQQQIRHANEIEQFLANEETGKSTNQALYTWMKREVKGLYSQCFEFAYDVARKAEKALQHETGDYSASFLKFGYLAGKEGLLAGEKLHLDIKRMEMAYHDLAKREYELTKHVSLLQLNPLALIQLRETGRCEISLPEALFDLDCPGHYFRRIKSVALSIPCVAGPYASVNCKLTLLSNDIRVSSAPSENGYQRSGPDDSRFRPSFVGMEAIVTSSAQNDSGLFETNLHGERYLPFEGAGAISRWRIELPDDVRQFDYDTITDVVLHLRYTAREGGTLLQNGAIAHAKELITDAQAAGSLRLFSVRQEFPAEWAHFQDQSPGDNQRFELTLNLRPEHYPFWSKGRLNGVKRVDVLARSKATSILDSLKIANAADRNDTETDILHKDVSLGDLLIGKIEKIDLPENPVGELKLFFDKNTLEELWIGISWKE